MKPEDKSRRIKQLIDEIGRPLVEQAWAECLVEKRIGAVPWALAEIEDHFDSEEAKWRTILWQLDETKDPSVLLPLLNVPDEVKPHFEDALKRRLMLCPRSGRPATPSYNQMSQTEARKRVAAMVVRYFKDHGVQKDKAVELTTLMFDGLPPKVGSSVRNLKARRRARARGTPG